VGGNAYLEIEKMGEKRVGAVNYKLLTVPAGGKAKGWFLSHS